MMTRARKTQILAALAAGAVVSVSACGGQVSAPSAGGEISAASCPPEASKALGAGDPIKIGMTIAQSGPLSGLKAISQGAGAFYDKTNATGGVDGHKIEFTVVDDAFDPARAVTNFKELVQKDNVMTVFGQVGTSSIKAAQVLAEQTCTPQLWTSTGDPALGDNPKEHAWTTAQLVPYNEEAGLWIKVIEKEHPQGARIGILTAANDQGAVYQKAVKDAVVGTKNEVVSIQSYDSTSPSFAPQITALLAAKPDVVLGAPDNQNCPKLLTGLAQSGFTGQKILSQTCSSVAEHYNPAGEAAEGAEVLVAYHDPGNPANVNLPDVKAYVEDMAKFGKGANPNLGYTAQGYNLAALMVANLKSAAAGKDGLSRVSLMNAAWHTDAKLPLGLDGVTARLDGAADPYLFNTLQLVKYRAASKSLVPVGDPFTYGK